MASAMNAGMRRMQDPLFGKGLKGSESDYAIVQRHLPWRQRSTRLQQQTWRWRARAAALWALRTWAARLQGRRRSRGCSRWEVQSSGNAMKA